MIFEPNLARWQKLSGFLAMVLLTAAFLAFVDAMVGGLKGNSGIIQLIPDSRFLISGPMPPKTEAIADFVFEGQAEDDSVRVVPEAIFSGYWFGGSMWRGAIMVSPDARPGSYTLIVKDRHGEKQNPALVFSVRIWPDLATQNANSPSFITRNTGQNPSVCSLVFLIAGILAGCGNFLLGWLWAKHLAERHCGEIYILRRKDAGDELTCEVQHHIPATPGMECTLYRRTGEPVGNAVITECDDKNIRLFVSETKLVHIGDVACFHNFVTGQQPS